MRDCTAAIMLRRAVGLPARFERWPTRPTSTCLRSVARTPTSRRATFLRHPGQRPARASGRVAQDIHETVSPPDLVSLGSTTVEVPQTSEVEVRYVQDIGAPVATTIAAADPHRMIRDCRCGACGVTGVGGTMQGCLSRPPTTVAMSSTRAGSNWTGSGGRTTRPRWCGLRHSQCACEVSAENTRRLCWIRCSSVRAAVSR